MVALASPPQELGGALFEEGGRAFLLVLRPGAQAEVGGLEDEALALTCIHSLVHRFERLLDSDRSVRSDHLQDGFRTRNEIGRRNDLVDEPDAKGLLRADDLSGQDELERTALSDQARQP